MPESADIRDIRLCIDRIIPVENKPHAMEVAIKVNPKNRPVLPPKLGGVSMHPAKIALFAGKKWKPKQTLGVVFLDGSATQRAKVIKYATSWMQYESVRFDFSPSAKPDIRVSFKADPGSWSAVGTDCLVKSAFPAGTPTMNFGWLQDGTDDVEYRRVVTHEFGHALGAIHEHQNPKGGIKWNLPAVYAYFGGPPNNWSKQEIDYNVVLKYSLNQLNATSFDRKSIMLYSFPAALVIGGSGTPENTQLSAGDKKFIAKMYPKK
jgi:hypothetical protein